MFSKKGKLHASRKQQDARPVWMLGIVLADLNLKTETFHVLQQSIFGDPATRWLGAATKLCCPTRRQIILFVYLRGFSLDRRMTGWEIEAKLVAHDIPVIVMRPQTEGISHPGDVVQQLQWFEHVVEHPDCQHKIEATRRGRFQIGTKFPIENSDFR